MSQQASYQGYQNSLSQYGNISYNISPSNGHGNSPALHATLVSPGVNMLTTTPATPTALVLWANGDVNMSFYGDGGGGTTIIAKFQPEQNITTYEYVLINQLMMAITTYAYAGGSNVLATIDPIAYIRKHNLERHFTFRQV